MKTRFPFSFSVVRTSIFTVLLILSAPSSVPAQWVQTNGPVGGSINALVVRGTDVFAGTMSGIFRSTDNGTSWSAASSGLTNGSGLTYPVVRSLGVSGTTLFAGAMGYPYNFRSTNNGVSWTPMSIYPPANSSTCFATSGTVIFAGTSYGAFRSTDNGDSWTACAITDSSYYLSYRDVWSLAVSGSALFAGTTRGVYRSVDSGATWTQCGATGYGYYGITALALVGTNLYAACGQLQYIYRSTDNGTSWTNTGQEATARTSLAVIGSYLFASTTGGVSISNDGQGWTPVNIGLPKNPVVLSLAVSGTNILAGTWRGVYLSSNNGASWSSINTGLVSTTVNSLIVSGTSIFAGTDYNGIQLSTNNGASWAAIDTNLMNNVSIKKLLLDGGNFFAATQAGMYLSTDNGTTWVVDSSGMGYAQVYALAKIGANLFAGTANGSSPGVFRSTNSGTNWTRVSSGNIWALAVIGTNLYAGTSTGVSLSTDNGTSWTAVGLAGSGVSAFAVMDTTLLAASAGGSFNGVYSYAGNGDWTSLGTSVSGVLTSLVVAQSAVFAGTSTGVFCLTNIGTSWSASNTRLTNSSVLSLVANTTDLFAGTLYKGAYSASLKSSIPPAPPRNLVVTDSSYVSFTLKWNKNTETDFLRYRIYRTKKVGNYWPSVPDAVDSTTGGINDTSTTFTPLVVGNPYSFYVTAVDSFMNESAISSTVIAVPFNVITTAYSTKRIEFGVVKLGTSKDTIITLYNTGNDTLRINWVYYLNTRFSSILPTYTIAPGGSAKDTIRFRPTILGADSAMILIYSNAASSPDTITASGFGAWYQLTKSVYSVDLGIVKPGTSRDTVITLTNAGNDTLRIISISSSRSTFVSKLTTANVAPGGSVKDTLRFTPAQSGPDTAKITIVSNSYTSPDIVTVTGIGATYGLSVSSKSIAMGIVKVGASKIAVVDFSNTGDDTLKITSISSTRPAFVSKVTSATLKRYGFVRDTLVYSPTQAGADSASIVIISNALSSPDTISMTGFGATYTIAINPSKRINMGTVKVGSKKDTLITISNTGNQPITNIGVTVPSGTPFYSSCDLSIPVGGSIKDTIRYSPLVDRVDSVRIVIKSSASSSPDTIVVIANSTTTGVEADMAIPTTFTLSQNYPNPFNPSTVIRYGLPMRSRVRLEIFDMLGRKVASLVDEEQSAHYYEKTWHASVSSGLYFYRLEAVSSGDPNKSFVQVRKMLLLK